MSNLYFLYFTTKILKSTLFHISAIPRCSVLHLQWRTVPQFNKQSFIRIKKVTAKQNDVKLQIWNKWHFKALNALLVLKPIKEGIFAHFVTYTHYGHECDGNFGLLIISLNCSLPREEWFYSIHLQKKTLKMRIGCTWLNLFWKNLHLNQA